MDWKYALSLELTDPGFDFTCVALSQACGKSATWWGLGGAFSVWPPRAGALVNGELLPLFPSLASIGHDWYESCLKLRRIRAAGPDGVPRILAVDARRERC
jgi:hypothetical protein